LDFHQPASTKVLHLSAIGLLQVRAENNTLGRRHAEILDHGCGFYGGELQSRRARSPRGTCPAGRGIAVPVEFTLIRASLGLTRSGRMQIRFDLEHVKF
jgi:hypothetical protein